MGLKSLLLTFVALQPLGLIAQTTLTDDDITDAYNQKVYLSRISCHDPSVVIDSVTNSSSPKCYIYGSHLGRGYATDESNYANWTTFKTGEESTSTSESLFANTSGTLVNYADAYSTQKITSIKNLNGETVTFSNFDAHGWQYSGNTVAGMQWAPDIIYNTTMKKWCLYESLNGDNWCSTIVCFTSDSPQGPWVYQGPVICGGFCGKYAHNTYTASNDWKYTDLAIATGCTSLPSRYNTSSWGNYWPNCIDPCVFYDASGNLWMSYGSWSGGIFIIRLDKSNGLRDYTYKFPYQINGVTASEGSANKACTSDPYFGKKIAGGYQVSGEASYIERIGDHYFLFTTYGGLTSTGGYQMRIFRSTNPDGPFVDAYGTSAVYTQNQLNYGPSATTNRGVLLMGGYQWPLMPTAEISQGHNSVFSDSNSRTFMVYHTRFNDGTEGHAVRVHQLFINQDDWIMPAPYEYSGETITNEQIASTASIADNEIPGTYQFIRHQYNQDYANKAYESPVDIYLGSDGTISGDENGTWVRTTGTDYISFTLSGVTYKGVLVRQTIDYSDMPAICISALSSGSSNGSLTIGQSTFTYQQEVWASKTDIKSAVKYTLDKNRPTFSNGSTITSDVILPSTSYWGCTVTWSSSNTSVLSSTGQVKGSGNVVLTMTISRDGYEYKKYYHLTVNPNGTESITYYPESPIKDFTSGWWTNFSRTDYTLAKGQTLKFKFYNHSSQKGNWDNYCLYGASATHGASDYTEYFGLRADNWDNTSASNTGCTCNYNWDTFLSDFDGALVDMTVSYTSDTIFVTAYITTTSGKTYTQGYTKAISASPSSIVLFFVNEASYIDGNACEPEFCLDGTTYYPESIVKNLTSGWWTNFSTKDYLLDKGTTTKFKFHNYGSKGGNWDNYCLYGASATHGASNFTEYFGVRADNWDNTSASNTGCTCNYNWNTFLSDLDSAQVEMTVNYTIDGVFTMTANITTTTGETYTQGYTRTISASPSSIVLFFVNEASYIDGSKSKAKDEWYTSLKTGDVNGDGIVSLADLVQLVDILNGKTDTIGKADVNNNGTITLGDIDKLLELLFLQ